MNLDLAEVLAPCMRAIRDRFRETVGLAVLDEAAAVGVILAAVQETGRFGFALCAGHRFPLHTGAPAKAMLAFLPQERLKPLLGRMAFPRFTRTTITSRRAMVKELEGIRARGYALDRAEEVEGCHCLAVPVFDAAGLPIAGVWFTGPSKRLPLARLKASFPELREMVDHGQRLVQARLGEGAVSASEKKIGRACRVLAAEPFADVPDLSALARSLGMSYSAFRHAFKVQVGSGPAQYRLARRIELAQRLLGESGLSLAAIAERAGFPSAAHFSTLFKKKTGVSPRVFRRGLKPCRKNAE